MVRFVNNVVVMNKTRGQNKCLMNPPALRRTEAKRYISALNLCTVQTFIESEDTRCCVNTIFHPEDGHVNARNMSRIIV